MFNIFKLKHRSDGYEYYEVSKECHFIKPREIIYDLVIFAPCFFI